VEFTNERIGLLSFTRLDRCAFGSNGEGLLDARHFGVSANLLAVVINVNFFVIAAAPGQALSDIQLYDKSCNMY